MGLKNFTRIQGHTPIDPNESAGLKIGSISTIDELNEWEQFNIEKALDWSSRRKFSKEKILIPEFIHLVHKKMFEDVWTWAGEIRKSNKNLGVDKFKIRTELYQLIENCKFWIENRTYDPDEIAIRFKYKIVSIHCYPNGNGRHSRLIADIIISNIFNMPVFSWGRRTLGSDDKARKTYLKTLKEADDGNLLPLLKFSRS
ncbi:mobile mystery protein B [Leptospira sarikeiensis]|uniref:Mobile mystery protein B n=1 Tax=Leptospira sarikeiensis TaxID=2484943 RepID=A0A4R9KDM4_9LEPT|nr:mobile mystery protein B [Leptospira sarikeiensis]TGL63273.1 mobile mystery protein B [Leptospira sarikeiensis]